MKNSSEDEIFIKVLLKLNKPNACVTNTNKIDERFQTHPPIGRKIDLIEKSL